MATATKEEANEEPREDRSRTLGAAEWIALAGVLLGYPLWVFLPLDWGGWIGAVYAGDRAAWWTIWSVLIASHAPVFALTWLAVARAGGWRSIGLDWGWFARRKITLLIIALALIASAWFAPAWLYPAGVPRVAESGFLFPLGGPERMFVLLAAVVAGVTEEIMYRGFAMTRLTRMIRSRWAAALVSSAAFAAIHYNQTAAEWGIYLAAGLVFAIPFVLMKLKRLEYLIAAHILVDSAIAFAP